ncbi:haloacid dehalogenase [Betaproteobacteria bacterium]|nr:haloacid dehalogenase [Betaproteobacteria bacterium]
MTPTDKKFVGAFENGFDGCVLVSDLDGTLIGNGESISDDNIAAIRAFVAEGGRFLGATGRTELSVIPFTRGLPLSLPWILYNGAAIYDWASRRFLYKAPLDRGLAEAFTRRVMERLPKVNIQVYCGGPFCQVSAGAPSDIIATREGQALVDKPLEAIADDWLKVLFCSDFPDELDAIETLFESDALRGKAHKMRSAARYFEFTALGVTKGSALARLRALLDPAPKCVVAIGDYINDIEMLDEADIAAAPESAHDAVKRRADIVTADHTQNAVADLLRRLRRLGETRFP